MCGSDCLSYAHNLDFELWNREAHHLNQFVRSLKSVQNGRQAQIEDAIECKYIDLHGSYDTKSGSFDNGQIAPKRIYWDMPLYGYTRAMKMMKVGLLVRLEAKPGKEEDLAAFLMQGLELANQETTTPLWFALRLGSGSFAIFDAFADESGRQAHLNGPIAKALMAQAPHLLAGAPSIEQVDVMGAKLP
jgi:quinol monooxygenase YgiN